MKPATNSLTGQIIQVLRGIDLLDEAVLHNNDSVTHGHSLGLVMCNVNEGGAESLMKLSDLGSHLCTELSVQVGERLVKQEDLRVTDDSTAESNTLSLTTGKSLRLSVEQVGDVEDTEQPLQRGCLISSFGVFPQLQTECHVVINGHVRVQSVVLEHHCDISVLRSNVVHELIADVTARPR